jgi:hypothetical protein
VLLQGALSLDFAAKASVTHDEYWHLPVGALHWKTGRFDWDVLNPPLLRLWAAIPVVFTSKTPPPNEPTPPGQYGDAFVHDHPQNFQALYFRGRVMVILLSLLTSSVLIVWARDAFGPLGGLFAAIVWCLSPNTIAHGSLITTDMGAVLGFVSVLWLLQRFADRPTWKNAAAWGLALGLAQGLKYTCLLLYPICLVGWFIAPRSSDDPRPKRLVVLGRFAAGIFLSLIVLKLVYLDPGVPQRLDSWKFRSKAATQLQERLRPVGWLPVPFPTQFIRGVDEQRFVMEQRHPVYLDGQWQESGFRSYYLKTMLYKLPLGTLALAALSVIQLISTKVTSHDWRTVAMVLIPAAVVVVVASLESMQLGLRYILPTIALSSIVLGRTTIGWRNSGVTPFKAATVLAVAASLLGLRYHPYDMAYFNEYAGGPAAGRLLLADSNIDWGQDLDGLKRYLDEQRVDEIGLAYFGTVPPEAVGIRYHLPPSMHPEPGLYAVSVNYVIGRPHVARDGKGGQRAINVAEFFYFGSFEPVKTIGWSIYVYRLTERDIDRWNAELEQMSK